MMLLAFWLGLAAFTCAYAGFKGYDRLRWLVLALAGGPLTLAILINKDWRDPTATLREAERRADQRHGKVEAAFAGVQNPYSPIRPRRRDGLPLATILPFRPRRQHAAHPPGKSPPRRAA